MHEPAHVRCMKDEDNLPRMSEMLKIMGAQIQTSLSLNSPVLVVVSPPFLELTNTIT